jgi:hypothetical protein
MLSVILKIILALVLTSSVLSIPMDLTSSNQITQTLSLGAPPVVGTVGYIRYNGAQNSKSCLFLNSYNNFEVGPCPRTQSNIATYVYGWVSYNLPEGQLLAPFRNITEASKNCMASGVAWLDEPGAISTRKLRLRGCADRQGGFVNIIDPVQVFWKIDTTAERISIGYLCLYAKNDVGSVCDSTMGGKWFGNETLVLRSCDKVKGDEKARFSFTTNL